MADVTLELGKYSEREYPLLTRYRVGSHPLMRESSIKNLEPTPGTKAVLKNRLLRRIGNGRTADQPELNRDTVKKYQDKQRLKQLDENIDVWYARQFALWLQGKSPLNSGKLTPWGTHNQFFVKGVVEYLREANRMRNDYQRKLHHLASSQPDSLYQCELFFKYIVLQYGLCSRAIEGNNTTPWGGDTPGHTPGYMTIDGMLDFLDDFSMGDWPRLNGESPEAIQRKPAVQRFLLEFSGDKILLDVDGKIHPSGADPNDDEEETEMLEIDPENPEHKQVLELQQAAKQMEENMLQAQGQVQHLQANLSHYEHEFKTLGAKFDRERAQNEAAHQQERLRTEQAEDRARQEREKRDKERKLRYDEKIKVEEEKWKAGSFEEEAQNAFRELQRQAYEREQETAQREQEMADQYYRDMHARDQREQEVVQKHQLAQQAIAESHAVELQQYQAAVRELSQDLERQREETRQLLNGNDAEREDFVNKLKQEQARAAQLEHDLQQTQEEGEKQYKELHDAKNKTQWLEENVDRLGQDADQATQALRHREEALEYQSDLSQILNRQLEELNEKTNILGGILEEKDQAIAESKATLSATARAMAEVQRELYNRVMAMTNNSAEVHELFAKSEVEFMRRGAAYSGGEAKKEETKKEEDTNMDEEHKKEEEISPSLQMAKDELVKAEQVAIELEEALFDEEQTPALHRVKQESLTRKAEAAVKQLEEVRLNILHGIMNAGTEERQHELEFALAPPREDQTVLQDAAQTRALVEWQQDARDRLDILRQNPQAAIRRDEYAYLHHQLALVGARLAGMKESMVAYYENQMRDVRTAKIKVYNQAEQAAANVHKAAKRFLGDWNKFDQRNMTGGPERTNKFTNYRNRF